MTHASTIGTGFRGSSENRKRERAELNRRLFYEQTQPFADVLRRRLREERTARGFTQAQLESAMRDADVPLPDAAVSKIESGGRPVSAEELLAFAYVLDVPLWRLVSPLDDELAVRFGGIGLASNEVANWLVWGKPWSREALTAQRLMTLARQAPTVLQAALDARNESDARRYVHKVLDIVGEMRTMWRIRPGVVRRQALRDAVARRADSN